MSIAQKQTREILDEDKNINKQEMERQIKQVTLTPEGYKSKRPIEGRVKYNVQRLINLFRLALENSIDVYNEGREKKDFSTVVETYNNLVNYANFFIKEENPSQNELSKLNDDLSKLNPLVDTVAQIADIGTSVDRNDMTELKNQWYSDKKPIGLTEKGLSARLQRTKRRTDVEEGTPEEGVSGAIDIEFQLQKLERFVNTLPNSDRKDTILKEIRALNKSFKIAQKEYYEVINSEDPIQKNKKKQKYDNLVEDIVNMINGFEDDPIYASFEAPESETVDLKPKELPAYARKYYDMLDELKGLKDQGRYNETRKMEFKIDALLKKHPQLRDTARPQVSEYDYEAINPATGERRIDEAYDAYNPRGDFEFYGMGRRRRLKGGVGAYIQHGAYDPKWDRDGAGLTLRSGAVEIPHRLNRQRGLPTAYRQDLAEASLLNKGLTVRNDEKNQLRMMEIEKGEPHGSKTIISKIKDAEKATIEGMGKRKQSNYRQERNEMYY